MARLRTSRSQAKTSVRRPRGLPNLCSYGAVQLSLLFLSSSPTSTPFLLFSSFLPQLFTTELHRPTIFEHPRLTQRLGSCRQSKRAKTRSQPLALSCRRSRPTVDPSSNIHWETDARPDDDNADDDDGVADTSLGFIQLDDLPPSSPDRVILPLKDW